MNYKEFVKATFPKLPASMKAQDKIKKIAQMWKAQKGNGGALSEDEQFGGVFSGLGMKNKVKKPTKKGGAYVSNAVRSGLHESSMSVPRETYHEVSNDEGGKMTPKKKLAAYKKMLRLEKKLHKGKITSKEYSELKKFHGLHGAGFWDDLWDGVKSVGSSIVNGIGQVASVVPDVVDAGKAIMPFFT
jgi:hypothetical protein